MDARAERRLWPSCLAAFAVVSALVFFLQPALSAVAAPGVAAPPDNPVRVRISPAHDALGGGALSPGTPRYHLIRVHNDGGSRFRYEVSVRTSGPLARLISVEFRAVSGVCDAAAFQAARVVVAGPAPMADVHGHGPAPLDPGQAAALCARVELPGDAVVDPAAGASDAVLRVTAVQR